jgi:hypothetical protein
MLVEVKVMPWFECPECGDQKYAKDWVECGNRHYAVGMYKILDWGKYTKPKKYIENKGVAEENLSESLIT